MEMLNTKISKYFRKGKHLVEVLPSIIMTGYYVGYAYDLREVPLQEKKIRLYQEM